MMYVSGLFFFFFNSATVPVRKVPSPMWPSNVVFSIYSLSVNPFPLYLTLTQCRFW